MSKFRWMPIAVLLCVFPVVVFAGGAVARLSEADISEDRIGDHYEAVMMEGAAAVPGLMAMVASSGNVRAFAANRQSSRAKLVAIDLLGELGSADALPLLVRTIRSTDSRSTINTAARAIGKVGGSAAFGALKRLLKQAEANGVTRPEAVTRAVVMAMGIAGDPRAIPILKRVANDSRMPEMTRIYAAGSLGLLGDRQGIAIAAGALEDPRIHVRLAATRALGVIGGSKADFLLEGRERKESSRSLRRADRLSRIQIRAAEKTGAERTDFIVDQIRKHPTSSALLTWGTRELSRLSRQEAIRGLEALEQETTLGFDTVRRAARIHLTRIQPSRIR